MRWVAWTGLIWLRIGTGGSSWKRGSEPSGSIKSGEFLVRILRIFVIYVVETGLEPYGMCSVSGITHLYIKCSGNFIYFCVLCVVCCVCVCVCVSVYVCLCVQVGTVRVV